MLKAVQDWDYAEVEEEQAFIVHQGTKGPYGYPQTVIPSPNTEKERIC